MNPFQTRSVHSSTLAGRLRPTTVWVLTCLLLTVAVSCDKFSNPFRRAPLSDMGPRMANSVKLTFDPSLTNLLMHYIDSCGSPHDLDVGAQVESVLIDAASQNFTAVSVTGGTTAPTPPDTEILISLQRSGLKLWQDSLYDRVPADMTLETLLTFKDAAGRELGQQTISITHNQRLILEPTSRRCDYGNFGEFIYHAGVALSTQFIRASRGQLAAAGGAPPAKVTTTGSQPSPLPAAGATAASAPSSLSFKATILDENGNLIFEGGERIRVRVDLVNSGEQDLQGVTASLGGTPSVVAQFPATTLSVGRLVAGQSRSIEFVATLPPSVQSQKAELHVTLTDPFARVPLSPQVLALTIQPTGVKTDDVERIPAVAAGFKRPNTYLVSIGIGSYRDQQTPTAKFASLDAEMIATYFQALGGLPAANVRLLQDWKALRPDIDEALLDWLPPHMNKEAVVIVYFAGLATVSATGETFLVPYDGTATAISRAYPLKELEAALARLKVKQTIFLFDGVVSRVGSDNRTKAVIPQWSQPGSSTMHVIGTSGVGRGLDDGTHRHSLFTYYWLRAMRGEADTNRDGEVTLGEAVNYVNQKVPWASKTQQNHEQRPLVLPTLKPNDPLAEFTLTKLAAVQGIAAH